MKNHTQFNFTVNGQPKTELDLTTSVLGYNNAVTRLLKIADKDSIHATTV